MYSGEWEWKYGPASMTQDLDGSKHWPIRPEFLAHDFPFSTEAEITELGLTKLEVYNLDTDGDGAPDVEDMEITFRHCMPAAGSIGKEVGKEVMDGITHNQDLGFFARLKHTVLSTVGQQPAKQKLTHDKFRRAMKKIALGTRFMNATTDGNFERQIFAVGRVRPSHIQKNTNKEYGGNRGDSRKIRDRSDARLFGRAFIIFENRREAYDVKLRFENKPFPIKKPVQNQINLYEWGSLDGEISNLRFEISGPEGKASDFKDMGVTLEITVVSCSNLPKKDVFSSIDAYVQIKYEGYEYKTEHVNNNLDPQFNKSFDFSVLNVDDPGLISLTVMDWDRLTKDDMVGSTEITPSMLAAMCDAATPAALESLELVLNGEAVVGANRQKASVQIRWRLK